MHPDCSACNPDDELTHERVVAALAAAEGNVTEAAKALGRHRTTVYRFIRDHRITFTRTVGVAAG
jgi:transcriptional regulator of acetoin/glycerol metabolism